MPEAETKTMWTWRVSWVASTKTSRHWLLHGEPEQASKQSRLNGCDILHYGDSRQHHQIHRIALCLPKLVLGRLVEDTSVPSLDTPHNQVLQLRTQLPQEGATVCSAKAQRAQPLGVGVLPLSHRQL